MEPIACKYVYPVFIMLGGLGLVVVALSSLIILRNPREKGGVLFLLTAISFAPAWLCVILPDAVGLISLGNAYYLHSISLCLGVVAVFFSGTAWFENRSERKGRAQISMAVSGGCFFIAWIALLPQVLSNMMLASGFE